MSDTSTEARRSSAITKILKHPATLQEKDEEKAEAYTEARVRSRDNLALEIRFADGRRAAFSYAYLVETDLDFDDHCDVLTLRFGRADIVVKGQALIEIYEKLLDQRARFIQQGTPAEEERRRSNEPYVENVEIIRKED